MTLVAHRSYQESSEVILAYCFMSATHSKVLLKVWQLPQSTHKTSLLFKVDTESLIHWIELVAKLQMKQL